MYTDYTNRIEITQEFPKCCGTKSVLNDSVIKSTACSSNPQVVNSKAPVPQQLQGEFRKLVFVGASPTRGSISNQDRGVIAASLPVKETVRVQIPAS